MNNFDVYTLCEKVGNEILSRINETSIILGTVRRDISRPKVAPNDIWPEQHFSVAWEIAASECENWAVLVDKYLYSAANALTHSIDEVIISQIVKILRTTGQIIPLHVTGARDCIQWMTNYWDNQKISTADRHFLLSPKCESHILCQSFDANDFNWREWRMLSTLQDYVVAFQQQAITVTSFDLKSKPVEHDTYVQTFQHENLCIRVICTRLPGEKCRIRVNWVGGITKFNLKHCGLIAENNIYKIKI